ncbi:hypothetical protein LTR16_003993, partial [Cryomyces antarcticus]
RRDYSGETYGAPPAAAPRHVQTIGHRVPALLRGLRRLRQQTRRHQPLRRHELCRQGRACRPDRRLLLLLLLLLLPQQPHKLRQPIRSKHRSRHNGPAARPLPDPLLRRLCRDPRGAERAPEADHSRPRRQVSGRRHGSWRGGRDCQDGHAAPRARAGADRGRAAAERGAEGV